MHRFMLKSKIHRVTVTDAHLDYEGSITIDENLMKAADLFPYERVDIYNVSNGERFSTYVIRGKKDSGVIGLNGAAARKGSKGDIIIIASYVTIENDLAKNWTAQCVFVDENNQIK
jgi:aspartate 1-decarboxylase